MGLPRARTLLWLQRASTLAVISKRSRRPPSAYFQPYVSIRKHYKGLIYYYY